MKTIRSIALALCAFLFAGGTTAQDFQSNNNLPDFNQIVLSGKMNVTIEEGDQNYFEIQLHNTDMSRVVWNCSEGKLNIRLRTNTQRDISADVKIICKRLNTLEVANASVRSLGPFTAGIFNLKIANGANVTLETTSKDVTVTADGNSATTLSGETLYLTIRANSKAKIDARALEARSAIVSTQFGAEVFVWGTEKLDANAGSNSVIYYKGTPEIFKRNETMMGSIEQFAY